MKIKEYLWAPVMWLLLLMCVSGVTGEEEPEKIVCTSKCKYQGFDGICNNQKYPHFGAAHTTLQRFIDGDGNPMVEYFNDNMPRGGNPSVLTSPRVISNAMMDKTLERKPSKNFLTIMDMQWGQLVVHDMMETKTIRGPDCCNSTDAAVDDKTKCFSFQVPEGDQFISSGCTNFVRSVPATTENVINPVLPDYLEQLNEKSSFLDLGVLYGDNQEKLEQLRDPHNKHLMRTNPDDILPENKNGFCRKVEDTDFCVNAGDGRAGQYATLTLVHIALLREHNRIAKQLNKLNPAWDDEKCFQETRRIMIAIFQHITYSEYLPSILDVDTMLKYDLYPKKCGFDSCYDEKINAGVTNSFATAAFRLHPQVTEHVTLLKADYSTRKDHLLKDIFFQTNLVNSNEGENCPDLARWMVHDSARKVGISFSDVMRNNLFGRPRDMGSINIQRGRDHGLPNYNRWRQYCGLEPKASFREFGRIGRIMSELYNNVTEVDLYVGGLTESRGSGRVGETFSCLIGQQFHLTKCGDRYWYERDDPVFGFTAAQLASIKKVTLSKLLCENFDLEKIQENAFIVPKCKRQLRYCTELPSLDLYLWKSAKCPKYEYKPY